MKSVSISQQKPKNLPTFNDFKNIFTNQEQNESIMIQETHIVKITLRKERRANIVAKKNGDDELMNFESLDHNKLNQELDNQNDSKSVYSKKTQKYRTKRLFKESILNSEK